MIGPHGKDRNVGFTRSRTSYKQQHTITLDGYAASHRAVREMKDDGLLLQDTKLRSFEVLEQYDRARSSRREVSHRRDARFKIFSNAAITIAGIELIRRIRKGQFNLCRLRIKDTSAPAVWNAVLSAH